MPIYKKKGEECDTLLVVLINTVGRWLCSLTCPNSCLFMFFAELLTWCCLQAEEKMRVVHDRKVSKLKRLDERGAENQKVDTTRTFIRGLSTKISMAIKVVDSLSVKISTIRDEELCPQLNELIKGYVNLQII